MHSKRRITAAKPFLGIYLKSAIPPRTRSMPTHSCAKSLIASRVCLQIRLGRPRLSAELKALIRRISHENPLWGTERIRGELLKLGIVVSNRSIRRYRWRLFRPGDSQRWRTFLSNQLRGIWAADLFVVQTVTFRTLYVFFCINHKWRDLIHLNVATSPIAAWIWHQLLEATPWGRRPKYLIH